MTAAARLEPVADRDYSAEMRAVIDAETGDGPYVSRQAADRIVARLRVVDPDLLRGWLELQAEHFVWQAINDRDRSIRAHARVVSRRTAFGAAAERFAAGDASALTDFLSMPFPVADGSRKRLAVMSAEDLLFAANEYEARERENAMTKAFLRALAKKVGPDTVSAHFSEAQLASMWSSIGR